MTPGWQKGHVEGDISHSGIGLKDGDDGNLHEHEEHWMLLEFDGERDGVKKDIDLEDANEEEAEVLKHLCEEIPEESDVWSEVWNRKYESIDRRNEVPGSQEEEGESSDHDQTAKIYERILKSEEPEAAPPQVHWDIQSLQEEQQCRSKQCQRIHGLICGQS